MSLPRDGGGSDANIMSATAHLHGGVKVGLGPDTMGTLSLDPYGEVVVELCAASCPPLCAEVIPIDGLAVDEVLVPRCYGNQWQGGRVSVRKLVSSAEPSKLAQRSAILEVFGQPPGSVLPCSVAASRSAVATSSSLKRRLAGRSLIRGASVAVRYMGRERVCRVSDADASVFTVDSATNIVVASSKASENAGASGGATEFPPLVAAVHLVLGRGSAVNSGLAHLGPRPFGILLRGPPGVGKTYAAMALEAILPSQVQFLFVSASELILEARSAATASLPSLNTVIAASAKAAAEKKQTFVVVDDLDFIANGRGPAAAALLTSLRALREMETVGVVGVVQDTTSLSPAFTSRDMLSRSVEMPAPNEEQRVTLWRSLMSVLPIEGEDQLVVAVKAARRTAGFVARDIERALRRAAICRAAQVQEAAEGGESLVWDDIANGIEATTPSQLASLDVQVPKGSWDDVAGYGGVKERLRQLISDQWSETRADTHRRLGVRPFKGVVLHGPSGCGKTILVNALAAECKAHFVEVHATELMSPFLGDSEAAVRRMFRSARDAAPCLLFIDELDGIAAARDLTGSGDGSSGGGVAARVLSSLLNEMDGIESAAGVMVVAATNRIEAVDAALLRPGRFDAIVKVPLPSSKDQLDIFRHYTREMPLAGDIGESCLCSLGWEGCSGADIERICRRSAMLALRQHLQSESGNSNDVSGLVVRKSHLTEAAAVLTRN